MVSTRARVPCTAPATCGVTFHYSGTRARCMSTAGRSPSNLPSVALTSSASTADANPEDVLEEIRDMGNDPSFLGDLRRRDSLRGSIERARSNVEDLKDTYKKVSTEDNFQALRRARSDLRELKFQLCAVESRLEEHKDSMAELAADLSDDQMYDGEDASEFLGKARREAQFTSGSVDWLNHRNTGIGGSDVNRIAGEPDWAKAQVAREKVSTFTEEDEQDVTDWRGPLGRGNAYENLIARDFSNRSREILGRDAEVLLNKHSYRGEHEWQVVNLDGLIRREGDDQPSAILECKTSSRPEDWADNSVPMGYRAQVLHYLNSTGYDTAVVGVCFDGRLDDIQYRTIHRDDPMFPGMDDTYQDYVPEMSRFWRDRHELARTQPKPRKYTFRDGFSDQMQLAAYRGESLAETRAAIARSGGGDQAYLDLMANSPRRGKRIHVDLETTGEEIIEFGAVVEDEDGRVIDTYSEVFSPDPRFLERRGTGFQDVHGITPEEVRSKRSFRDAQGDIKRFLRMDSGESITMVAHNAMFEASHLDQDLDGFHQARRGTDPQIRVLDTMKVSQKAVHSTPNNKLSSFVERFGGRYQDAHRALNDAIMMKDALNSYSREAMERGTGRI